LLLLADLDLLRLLPDALLEPLLIDPDLDLDLLFDLDFLVSGL
jgi:hypothetical protein